MAYKLLLRCASEYIGFRASRDTARVFKCFSVHTKKMWTAAVSLKGLNKGCFCVYCNWRNHWLRTTALHNSEGSGWLCSMLWFSNAVELLLLFDEKRGLVQLLCRAPERCWIHTYSLLNTIVAALLYSFTHTHEKTTGSRLYPLLVCDKNTKTGRMLLFHTK